MLPYYRCQILLESEIWSEHLGNGEKCFVFGEQQVKCLACIHFSCFSWAAVLKTAQNTNNLPAFMNSDCPNLWGCVWICMRSTVGEWGEEIHLEKLECVFGLVPAYRDVGKGWLMQLQKMWLTHQKIELWCIWRSQLCFMNMGVGSAAGQGKAVYAVYG